MSHQGCWCSQALSNRSCGRETQQRCITEGPASLLPLFGGSGLCVQPQSFCRKEHRLSLCIAVLAMPVLNKTAILEFDGRASKRLIPCAANFCENAVDWPVSISRFFSHALQAPQSNELLCCSCCSCSILLCMLKLLRALEKLGHFCHASTMSMLTAQGGKRFPGKLLIWGSHEAERLCLAALVTQDLIAAETDSCSIEQLLSSCC